MTMQHFIEVDGAYVVHVDGFPEQQGYIEVPPRPDPSSVWADGAWVAPDPILALVDWRASARCSPMQGKLALGQTEWAKVELYRDTEATWAQRVVIDGAQEWRRNSQDIQFFGYMLQYTDAQMDALFEAAMQITV